MGIATFFINLNYMLSIPTAIILLGVALYFTLRFKFLQLRKLPYFFSLITQGIPGASGGQEKTINPFYALFTAMSTSIGMGTIVGPSVAIIMGGPGALFWLLVYALAGAATKFVEVTSAVALREKESNDMIIGGPMQYLNAVHPHLGLWYAAATMVLFGGWSGLQTNVLADVLHQEGLPYWLTGFLTALLVYTMLAGGAVRIGKFNTQLVPVMFFLYVSIGVMIIIKHSHLVLPTLKLVLSSAFSGHAAVGGIAASTMYAAFCSGIYKGAFITESGIGTSAIPHALANVKKPTDQGILAMTSVFVDTLLCTISGLLVLLTGVWQKATCINNTLMYQVFESNVPYIGRSVLVVSIIMFVTGTVVGNSFNGRQSFATLTSGRWLDIYAVLVCCVIMLGAVSSVPVLWSVIELLLPFVAIPNALGLVYLSVKKSSLFNT
jgi:AGCS family alanine or glycine:cation symporter